MKLSSLYDLLVAELQEIYDAEQQIVVALPELATAAESQDLAEGFNEHLEQTQGQIYRLEEIAAELGIELSGHQCLGLAGIIKEGGELAKIDRSLLRDLALIGVAKRVEHYEMARYENARMLAEAMEQDDVADLLQETLDEEESSDRILSEAAETIMSDLDDMEVDNEQNVLASS